jgi:hypothetical protein
MTSTERHRSATRAARRRRELHRTDGDRRVAQIIKARRALARPGKGDAVGAPATQFGIYGRAYAHGSVDATSAYA